MTQYANECILYSPTQVRNSAHLQLIIFLVLIHVLQLAAYRNSSCSSQIGLDLSLIHI